MAYAEVVVSSSQPTSQSLLISVLDLMPSRAGEPASSAGSVRWWRVMGNPEVTVVNRRLHQLPALLVKWRFFANN